MKSTGTNFLNCYILIVFTLLLTITLSGCSENQSVTSYRISELEGERIRILTSWIQQKTPSEERKTFNGSLKEYLIQMNLIDEAQSDFQIKYMFGDDFNFKDSIGNPYNIQVENGDIRIRPSAP